MMNMERSSIYLQKLPIAASTEGGLTQSKIYSWIFSVLNKWSMECSSISMSGSYLHVNLISTIYENNWINQSK